MFSLKSELFKKQQELTSRSGNATVDAIRKKHAIKTSEEAAEHKVPDNERNRGVEERNARDLEKTAEEEDKSKMVKSVLEAKAKLYDRMTSGDILPDEESSAVFLVDFEQKSIEARMKKSAKDLDLKPKVGVNVADQLSAEIVKATHGNTEEWVEYTDGLGRTRMCLRKDLPKMQKIDRKLGIGTKEENQKKTLLSDDMRREMEREQWEEEALEEVNGPMHYENLRAGEIRELGVGYYAFSTDQETREAQMKMLRNMREETRKEKESLKESQRKKRTALQARLEKVRLGRLKKLKALGKEIPAELLKPIELPSIEDEKAKDNKIDNDVTIAEVSERDDTTRPVREWDKDKEWIPAEPPKPPKSWQNPRDERPDEFAPPSFYFKGKKSSSRISSLNKNTDSDTEPAPPGVEDPESPPCGRQTETSNDLISRIRRELTQVANSNADSANDSLLDIQSTSTAKVEKPPQTDNLTHRNATLPPENSPTPGLYVPSDKPVIMKVKALPKKKSLLQNKQTFSDN